MLCCIFQWVLEVRGGRSSLDLLVLGLIPEAPELARRPEVEDVGRGVGEEVVLGAEAALVLRDELVEPQVLGDGLVQRDDRGLVELRGDVELHHVGQRLP